MKKTHRPECVWGNSDCEYKNTHYYCPHEEHKSLECECSEKPRREGGVVATVEKSSAIDLTPIYKITMKRGVKAGTVLTFDSAQNVITLLQNNNK